MSNEVIDMLAPAPVLTPPAPVPAVQQPAPSGPMGMAMQALSMGMTVADLHSLLALQKDYEANEARKAYVADMAAFKLNPPEILKTKLVGFKHKEGDGYTGYMHATLGDVCEKIVERLAQNGFSHRWDTQQPPGGQIYVTCTLTHRLGHSESTTLNSSADTSGKKNNIQAMASTVSYLQRYTLLSASGLATKDMSDDDGRAGGNMGLDTGIGTKEATDEEILDGWIKYAQAATTNEDLTRIRTEGLKAYQGSANPADWEKLKEAIIAHRAVLAEKAVQS